MVLISITFKIDFVLLSKTIGYETSMLKALSPKGMIISEQHVTIKKQ
jgi:hypothetical protein